VVGVVVSRVLYINAIFESDLYKEIWGMVVERKVYRKIRTIVNINICDGSYFYARYTFEKNCKKYLTKCKK